MKPASSMQGPTTSPVRAEAVAAATLNGVRKRFGYRDVLRGLNLEIPAGGCFVVTGPNGAGKSTLLRILATQWTCTQGEVKVLGFDVRREARAIRARTGVVFHEPFLRRELTLEENLEFAGTLYGLTRNVAKTRREALLERFGLLHRRKDAVGTFSQGMVKRASLARSLLADPDLWILDEPFSGLDPEGQEILSEELRGFVRSQRGRTIVLVTHSMALAASLATASARIEDGRVVAGGQGAAGVRLTDARSGAEEAD